MGYLLHIYTSAAEHCRGMFQVCYALTFSGALSSPVLSLPGRWAHQRKVFGKPLLSQPVIRSKLAAMVARVESVQNWLENVTFQMCKMSYREQSKYLAGQMGFLKMFCTRTAQETAADATQIFGGRAISECSSSFGYFLM